MKGHDAKQRLITIVVFLFLCGVIGLTVMISGVVPIKASSGHWEMTKWVLNFSKGRSVAFHSRGIDPPPLDDPAMVLKGAGHYETGCVQCHGSPTRPASPIALSMTASPPALPPKIEARDPEELFYIVKHGIKFTGMPAWPTQHRDDEVWAMVAFLLELPGMDEQRYRELTSISTANTSVKPDTTPIEGVSASTVQACIRCHGRDGRGRGAGAFPKIAGQKREYLLQSLRAYADGNRHSGMMQPVAAILSDAEQESLANYFSLQPAAGATTLEGDHDREARLTPDSQAIERGRTIAREGIPSRNVASCVDCHGPGKLQTAPGYPHLAGQYSDYTILQLQLFQRGHRGGTASAHLMAPVVQGLTEEDIHDVAAYYASISAD